MRTTTPAALRAAIQQRLDSLRAAIEEARAAGNLDRVDLLGEMIDAARDDLESLDKPCVIPSVNRNDRT